MSKTPERSAVEVEQALLKAMPLLCRASSEMPAPQLRTADGGEMTAAVRDELLAKCMAGQHVELEVDLLAYEQQAGVQNRNYVRFRDGAMMRLGSSGRGKPLLRDHEQGDVLARGGTIKQSLTTKRGEGDYAIRMTARLTAPWAVELALRELLGGTSIGWNPTGPVECSICGTPILSRCWHFPGDRLSETTGEDGKKQYTRDPKGTAAVEWVYTDAELTECSFVSVPGVATAGVEQVRAMLSAALGGDADGTPVHATAQLRDESHTQSAKPTEGQEMSDTTDTSIATKTAELEASFDARVAERATKLAAERAANVKEARKIARSLAISEDAAEECVDAHPADFSAAKLAILKLATERQDGGGQPRTQHVEIGAEASDKKRGIVEAAILARMSGERPTDPVVARYAKMSLLALGDELFEDAGISSRDLRDIDSQNRAKLMLGMHLPIGFGRKLSGPGGANSTSDFPLIIGSVFNTRMRALYQRRQQSWKAFAYKENLPSFDAVPTYMGGRFPKLLPVKQGATYQRGSFSMNDMSVQLSKAGRIVSLTWELILADRIGLIERAISDRVNSAIRWEDELFYTRLIANLMADGTTAIYDATNTATGGAISATTLASGFVKMATREDPTTGDPTDTDEPAIVVNVKPKFWLCPATGQVAAEQLLGDGFMPTSSSGAPTRDMRGLSVIGDGNLDANSVTDSFLFADPTDAVTVQYGHLASEDGPVLEEEPGFTVDGKDYKVRATGYVEFVDNVGTVKMPIS
jgi:hypothetical protein